MTENPNPEAIPIETIDCYWCPVLAGYNGPMQAKR
ncbi:protein of unknown function [Rhodovastum atsumiense]|nr:protein of unknown function [Rhodovastum atsumiense]